MSPYTFEFSHGPTLYRTVIQRDNFEPLLYGPILTFFAIIQSYLRLLLCCQRRPPLCDPSFNPKSRKDFAYRWARHVKRHLDSKLFVCSHTVRESETNKYALPATWKSGRPAGSRARISVVAHWVISNSVGHCGYWDVEKHRDLIVRKSIQKHLSDH